MEFFFEVFLRTIFGLELVFRKPLRRAIPCLDELRENPADVLAVQEIRIGPSIRWVLGTVMGVVVGVLFGCGLSMAHMDTDVIRPGPPPPAEVALRYTLLFGPTVLASALFIYLLRGGELVATSEGVSFRRRGTAVVAPWSVFASAQDFGSSGPLAVFLSVPKSAIEELRQESRGDVVALGSAVNAKQLRPLKRRVGLVVRDLYAVRIDHIIPLLAEVGQKLAPPRMGNPFANGHPGGR